MALVKLAILVIVAAAVIAGTIYSIGKLRRQRRHEARALRHDAEMRKNTWFNSVFRRDRKLKRIGYVRPVQTDFERTRAQQPD